MKYAVTVKFKNSTTDYSDQFLRRVISWCCKQLDMPVRLVKDFEFRNKTTGGRYSGHCYGTRRIVVSTMVCRVEPAAKREKRLKGNLKETVQWLKHLERTGRCDELTNITIDDHTVTRGEHAQQSVDRLQAELDRPYDEQQELARQLRRRTIDLVSVTAHELFHACAHHRGMHTRRNGRSRGSSERLTERQEAMVREKFVADYDALVAEWSKQAERKAATSSSVQEVRAARAARNLANWERKLKLAKTKVQKYKQKCRYYDRVLGDK